MQIRDSPVKSIHGRSRSFERLCAQAISRRLTVISISMCLHLLQLPPRHLRVYFLPAPSFTYPALHLPSAPNEVRTKRGTGKWGNQLHLTFPAVWFPSLHVGQLTKHMPALAPVYFLSSVLMGHSNVPCSGGKGGVAPQNTRVSRHSYVGYVAMFVNLL